MRIGNAGIALIKSFEQCRLHAFLPTLEDVPTIGWGATGRGIHLGLVWTQAQADARLAADLATFAEAVTAMTGTAPTTQHQFDALVSLGYNIGVTAFAGSSVLRRHNAGDHPAAAAAFSLWVKQKGKVLAGLVRRRHAEAALYLN